MRTRLVLVATLAGLLGVACSSGGSEGSSSSTTTTSPAATGAELARQVSLHDVDVVPGDTVKLIDGGDKVAGQVTMDLCGTRFASEARRRVRYQVQTNGTDGRSLGLSTEAVLYDSPEGAKLALDEMRAAQASCPPGYTDSTVRGVPPVITTFGPTPGTGWAEHPGVDRYTLDVTVTAADGRSFRKVLVYQVRGPMLVGVYVSPDTGEQALPVSMGGTQGFVNEIADRLAAIPASALAGATAV